MAHMTGTWRGNGAASEGRALVRLRAGGAPLLLRRANITSPINIRAQHALHNGPLRLERVPRDHHLGTEHLYVRSLSAGDTTHDVPSHISGDIDQRRAMSIVRWVS